MVPHQEVRVEEMFDEEENAGCFCLSASILLKCTPSFVLPSLSTTCLANVFRSDQIRRQHLLHSLGYEVHYLRQTVEA